MAGVCLGAHQRWARRMGTGSVVAAVGRWSRRSPARLRRPRAGCGERRDGQASSRTRRVVVVRARQWRDGLVACPRTGTAGRELQMSQTKNFNLPDLGEGLPDATIVEWFVKEGDVIKLDEPLVSMETAKAVVEVPSPYSGKVTKLHGKAGDVIETGAALADFLPDPKAKQRAEAESTGHQHGPKKPAKGAGATAPDAGDQVVASDEGGEIDETETV